MTQRRLAKILLQSEHKSCYSCNWRFIRRLTLINEARHAFLREWGQHGKAKVTDMLNSKCRHLPLAVLAALCGTLLAPSGAAAAMPAGAVFSPGALPPGVFKSIAIERVQQRRAAQIRRRAIRRARRQIRRARRSVRRGPRGVRQGRRYARHQRRARRAYRRGRWRHRGPYLAIPSLAIPYYYSSDPYYDYDPYYYSGYDYTPAPAPGGSCSRWSRRCTANWGYGNPDYWGCMRYHGCN